MEEKRGQHFKIKKKSNFLTNLIKYWYLALSLIIIGIILILYLFLIFHFQIGDVVYKINNPEKIGVIRAISFLNLGYTIFWRDDTYSSESFISLENIDSIPEDRLNNSNYSNESIQENYNKTSQAYNDFYNADKPADSFQDYIVESSSGEKTSSVFYKGTSLGVSLADRVDCNSNFLCGEWSECKIDYGVFDLISEELPYGVQYKYCEDKNGCLPFVVDSRPCSLGENLVVKRINCNGQQIIFVNFKGKVVAKLLEMNNKVGVNINLIEEGECDY